MHLGRKYKVTEYLLWTRWEIAYLLSWSLFVTFLLEVLRLNFLVIPSPLLAVVGTAVAIILAFKNQQCHARINEALAFWGQINSASIILANKLAATVANLDAAQSGPWLKDMYYRHFAWLTALRFFCAKEKPGRIFSNRETPNF